MSDWEAATWEGARLAQERAVAALTPAQRLAWLEEALEMAAASGALARERQERERETEDMWQHVRSAHPPVSRP